jgi:hypothetical protein
VRAKNGAVVGCESNSPFAERGTNLKVQEITPNVAIVQREGIRLPYLGGADLGEPAAGAEPFSGMDGSSSRPNNPPVS